MRAKLQEIRSEMRRKSMSRLSRPIIPSFIEKRYSAPSAWANQAQAQFAVFFWTETSGAEVQ
jgi:hypothetical protein